MTNILEKIIAHKKKELSANPIPDFTNNLKSSTRSFQKALQNPDKKHPKLIAEIKRKSPSKGLIFPKADISKIAKIYEQNGAAAISCLTDEYFFGGNTETLKKVTESVNIPVLRKDFIIEKSQIQEARYFGADAVLLMTSVLKTAEKLREFREYAEKFNMDCLVETHDLAEIKIAVDSGAKIIGVNSRDFNDPELRINLENFQTCLPHIPKGIIRVAESGLEDLAEIEKIKPLCEAILVGTNFMQTKNYTAMAKLVKDFQKA